MLILLIYQKLLILIEKLINEEIPPDIVGLIGCYLESQSARIIWNGGCNEYKPIKSGVRQGGILSPLLFYPSFRIKEGILQ